MRLETAVLSEVAARVKIMTIVYDFSRIFIWKRLNVHLTSRHLVGDVEVKKTVTRVIVAS